MKTAKVIGTYLTYVLHVFFLYQAWFLKAAWAVTWLKFFCVLGLVLLPILGVSVLIAGLADYKGLCKKMAKGRRNWLRFAINCTVSLLTIVLFLQLNMLVWGLLTAFGLAVAVVIQQVLFMLAAAGRRQIIVDEAIEQGELHARQAYEAFRRGL